jgi:predicted permease
MTKFLVLFTISLALPLTFSAFDFLNEIIELLILSAWILGVQIPILMRMFFSLNTK